MAANWKIGMLAAIPVAGCLVVSDARNAQKEYEQLARDDGQAVANKRIDLSEYTLSQLVDYAIMNRPSFFRRNLEVEDAWLAMRQLSADAPLISETPWRSPRITAGIDYGESSEPAHFDSLKFRTDGGAAASINLSIPIYDFGRHDAAMRSAGEAVLTAELMLVNEGFAVFNEVTDAYFTLLEKCALKAVALTNEYEYAMHLEQVEKRLEAGEAKELDLSRARLDLAQAKEEVVSAQADIETAGAEFQRALGIDASRGSIGDVVGYPEDPLAFLKRGFPDTDFSVETAFEFARTNAPGMRVYRSRLRAASAEVDYAIADLAPEISASVSLNWTDPLWYWHWGVSAAQTLFQGFRKKTAVERAVNAMRRSAMDVESGELELSLALEKAVAARDTARKAQETAEASLKASRDNLRLIRQQFAVGDVTRIEYAEAVSALAQATSNRISSFYRRQRAECALFPLIGVYPVYEEKKLTEADK